MVPDWSVRSDGRGQRFVSPNTTVGTARLTRDARQAGQLGAVDALEVLDVAGQHDQDVVVGTGHQEAPHDGGAFHHLRLERLECVIALALQGYSNQNRRGQAELGEVERGLVALDVAVVL